MTWATLTYGEPVERARRVLAGVDRYGNPTYTWDLVTLPVLAAFDPGGSTEPVEVERQSVVTTPTLYFPEVVDIDRTDELIVRGRRYAVEGIPADWADPWGTAVGGTVVPLREVEG